MALKTTSLLITLFTLLVLSAFFSAAETAYTGLSLVRIKKMAQTKKRAHLVLQLSKDYDRVLSTILIGSNIVNITAASISTIIFTDWLGSVGITVSTIVLTITIIIFCEISPKSLTKETPETVAVFCAVPLLIFKYIFIPINFLFNLWKKLLNKIFKVKKKPSLTEEEFTILVDDITDEGVLEQSENYVIQNTIISTDKTVADIMTPLSKTVFVKVEQSAEDVYRIFHKERYSRMPVKNNTEFIGAIYMKDFYQMLLENKNNWNDIIKRIIYVSADIKIFSLFKQLQTEHIHLAMVEDASKNPIGMITMEDILEEIVGDIYDEYDKDYLNATDNNS